MSEEKKKKDTKFSTDNQPSRNYRGEYLKTVRRDKKFREEDVEKLAELGMDSPEIIAYLSLDTVLVDNRESKHLFDIAVRRGQAAYKAFLLVEVRKQIKEGKVTTLGNALQVFLDRYSGGTPVVDEEGLLARVKGIFNKLEEHRKGKREK